METSAPQCRRPTTPQTQNSVICRRVVAVLGAAAPIMLTTRSSQSDAAASTPTAAGVTHRLCTTPIARDTTKERTSDDARLRPSQPSPPPPVQPPHPNPLAGRPFPPTAATPGSHHKVLPRRWTSDARQRRRSGSATTGAAADWQPLLRHHTVATVHQQRLTGRRLSAAATAATAKKTDTQKPVGPNARTWWDNATEGAR